jgi:hypothetical protein
MRKKFIIIYKDDTIYTKVILHKHKKSIYKYKIEIININYIEVKILRSDKNKLYQKPDQKNIRNCKIKFLLEWIRT